MTTTIVLAGVVLGLVQLWAGLALGVWIGDRRSRRAHPDADAVRASHLASELLALASGMGDSVRRHTQQMVTIGARLEREADKGGLADSNHPLTHLVVGVVGELVEVTGRLQRELAAAETQIEEQAEQVAQHMQRSLTDPLTGLPNRRALDEHLAVHAETWRRRGTPFSVVMLDVDHFKRFNDTHGHPAGDEALRTVGQALSASLRTHDIVCRYGGEEFAVLLPQTTLENGVAAVRKALAAVAAARVTHNGRELSVTASAGLASIEPRESGKELLTRADQALYAAKRGGRARGYQHDGQQTGPLDPVTGATVAPTTPDLALPAELPSAAPSPEAVAEADVDALRQSLAAFIGPSDTPAPGAPAGV